MGLSLAMLSVTAVASPWVVDGTSLAVTRGAEPVSTHVACPAPADDDPTWRERTLHTLGVALVAYAKKQGTMTWGHASLRVIYCLDGALEDVEFEVYRLSGWNELQLREEHPSEAFARSAWLTTQRGRLVLFRNPRPVDGGWYAKNQADNREIYEVWLDLSREQRDAVTRRIEDRHLAQLVQLRDHDDLDRRYVAWRDNCTDVFHALPASITDAIGFPLTPFAWVRHLERADLVKARVLYPSHHLVKRWKGDLPSTSKRLHPLFRRPPKLPLPVVGQLHRAWLNAAPAVADIVSATDPASDAPETASVWYRRSLTPSTSQ